MGAGLKGKKGPHSPSVRLPLPLAALCCFACFFAGSFYSGKQFQSLPDLKQPSRTSQQHKDAGKAQQHEGDIKQAGSVLTGGAARRQLAADVGQLQSEVLNGRVPATLTPGDSGDAFLDVLDVQMISWQPRAYIFKNFAPPEKCQQIVETAKKHLAPSGLALRAGETTEGTRDIRTSSGAFLASSNDPSGALKWVEEKMARVTMIPSSHGEAFNVLRYNLGQHYDSHMDVFDPKEYGPQSSNRMASFLLYLTDVEEGGETMFPYEGGNNMNSGYNFKDCIGLKVKPKKGDALLFWSMKPDGSIDPHSLHGSCPVIKGEKWVATKWIRDKKLGW